MSGVAVGVFVGVVVGVRVGVLVGVTVGVLVGVLVTVGVRVGVGVGVAHSTTPICRNMSARSAAVGAMKKLSSSAFSAAALAGPASAEPG
ncbi:MAG: hypothetical protein IPO29_10960 [Anaerolineae bacterium]|nr:hypothetical protein [Anaerolineae bacterium]